VLAFSIFLSRLPDDGDHSWYRWHDAGTYDKTTNTGGPNGSIRFPEELRHAANAGLKIAVDLLGE
jgi:catalase (peroxidase I)